eukprot:gene8087-12548_t
MKFLTLTFCLILFFQITYSTADECCSGAGCNQKDCNCFSDVENGFWKKSTEENICGSCQFNFDLNQHCTKCSENYFGTTCEKICNISNCYPLGGKCDINGTCECLNSADDGYWSGNGCFSCKLNYEIKDQCKTCLPGFDIARDCTVCEEGKFGPFCNVTCNCNTEGGKCDENGICVCFNSTEKGFWTGAECSDCQGNYDLTSKCRGCVLGYDINKECKVCVPDRYGNACGDFCHPLQKCHGNGFCFDPKTSADCICYENNERGHWNKTGDCKNCQTGYNETSNCKTPTCHKNGDGLECSGKGFCIGPNICKCPFNAGDYCQTEICYGIHGPSACNGNGYCAGYDTCQCDAGFRGRQCEFTIKSDIFYGGVIILVTLTSVSVVGILIFILVLLRKKNVTSNGDAIKWSELEDEDNDFMVNAED